MKIALVGAAGSGKTEYAKKLAAENTSLLIVDDIPQNFQADTGMATGRFADYRVNVMLASERLKIEWEKGAYSSFIMTTTLLDSVAYQTFTTHEDAQWEDPSVTMRNVYAMGLLGVLTVDNFKFDKVFYLPWTPPKTRNEDIGVSSDIDRTLRESLDSFKIVYEEV